MLVLVIITLSSILAVTAHPYLERRSGHQFTLTNKCGNNVQPVIADTRCGYSPRCGDAAAYSGPQPRVLGPGQSQTVTINSDWVGRIFVQNGRCGSKGESCTLTEYNLDTGNQFTPQAYDISNIQGFTQSIQLGANGCDTVTCTNANCGCSNAYPVGDLSGCGNDSPVRACGAGDIAFNGT
ncbi:hypothetical protein BU17DRAFT_40116 [Hysterangium stoloniferum]|nr:hypothetical protein BU17DRAFT_40116 [Hysterangium stoloniferum]